MDIRTKITGIQHVGVPTDDIQNSILFYKVIGFEVVWQTINEQNGESVVFLRLGNLIMEVYENKQAAMKSGAIDHIALDVTGIDAVFSQMKELGYEMLDDHIRFLPFWDYGVRFFTIIGPNKEKIEFCEKQITPK
ncbi:VOC family protein [Bacteroides cellulosilyticus]|uniref:VOC family protein n=1 Tax=Bacteroides cellulosilyticus TaxID=246787 RepID=UPI00189C5BE2|nr:VOC family protein [Bacteroides cellulosilyticus]